MSTIKIKRGDQVVVIAGAFKGIIGTVLKIDIKKQVVYVSGVRPNTKYLKKNVQSGRTTGQMFDKPRPVNISNVMFYETDKAIASRLAIKIDADGNKIRVSKKTGTILKPPTKNILISSQPEVSNPVKSEDSIMDVKTTQKKPKSKE